LQDIIPAPLARAIVYKAAGPISALGYQSPTLAQIMARQAILDPKITRPSSVKRKTLALAASSGTKKRKVVPKKIIQVRSLFLWP
jgi:hypothetical protein